MARGTSTYLPQFGWVVLAALVLMGLAACAVSGDDDGGDAGGVGDAVDFGGADPVVDGPGPDSDARRDQTDPDRGSREPDADVIAHGQALLFEPCPEGNECAPGLSCADWYPMAFCSVTCSVGDCPAGSECFEGHCAPSCGEVPGQCDRYGAMCLKLDDDSGPCIAACASPGEPEFRCEEAWMCDQHTAQCRTDRDEDGAPVGAACSVDADCRAAGCFPEQDQFGLTGWLGGYCVGLARYTGFDPWGGVRQASCPPGSRMAVYDWTEVGDAALCFAACLATEDCRPGYVCSNAVGGAAGWCVPGDCERFSQVVCPPGTACLPFGEGHLCTPCESDCEGRVCGSDSCAGECGACPENEDCTDDGQCVCTPETDAELCEALDADCDEVTVEDQCGTSRTIDCGDCSALFTCALHTPNQCDCDAESNEALCETHAAECDRIDVTDSCGLPRSPHCGGCIAPDVCNPGNTCGPCEPRCSGRECGPDGCGDFCGSCESDEICSDGRCAFDDDCDPVTNTGCPGLNECLLLSTEETRCVLMGTGVTGSPCSTSVDCRGGYACFESGCRKICDLFTGAGCLAGEGCAEVGGWFGHGVCAFE